LKTSDVVAARAMAAIICPYRHASSRDESGGSCQMTIVTLVKLNTESRLLIGPAHKQDHFPSDDGLDAATRTFEAIQRRCRSSLLKRLANSSSNMSASTVSSSLQCSLQKGESVCGVCRSIGAAWRSQRHRAPRASAGSRWRDSQARALWSCRWPHGAVPLPVRVVHSKVISRRRSDRLSSA
jgi:hypothetical protein